MAIRMSEPFQHAPRNVQDEVQDAILKRGGSSDLARVILASNEFARDKGDENRALRDAIERLRQSAKRSQELILLASVQDKKSERERLLREAYDALR